MEISFDNDGRLRRKTYLFEYREIRFRLIQHHSREYADHLLSILPSDVISEREHAFSVASEFLSALGWANKARTAIWESGGRTWPDKLPLSKARPRVNDFRILPFKGRHIGCSIDRIPKIETEGQRIALTLYREACASNNDYLSFIFFWQILEVGCSNAEGFVDKTHRKLAKQLTTRQKDINSLPLRGRKLGEYLRDECRDAIAHIRRKPGKKKLDLNLSQDRTNSSASVRVAKTFSEYYIRENLYLRKQLCLVREGRRGFPRCIDQHFTKGHKWELAYPNIHKLS